MPSGEMLCMAFNSTARFFIARWYSLEVTAIGPATGQIAVKIDLLIVDTDDTDRTRVDEQP